MKIIATIGDCNGIGLEALVKAANSIAAIDGTIELALAGNSTTVREYIGRCVLPADVSVENDMIITPKAAIRIVECGSYSKVRFGTESADAGRLAVESIGTAHRLVSEGEYEAMVTMPISKYAIHLSGSTFPGHTEMLSFLSGSVEPLMILFSGDFRVALVTVHIPIAEVPRTIGKDLICRKARLFNGSLMNDFSVARPRIAVLGLNPHAGENGGIGKEELDTVNPALAELHGENIDVQGPFPADGFFAHRSHEHYDGVLAMYHDQGLIALKLLAQGGVNYTAGLPVVRTSPDHGTAFLIAGKGVADISSTVNAVLSAKTIVESRKRASL